METIKRTESEKKIRPLLPIKTSRGLEMQFTEERVTETEELGFFGSTTPGQLFGTTHPNSTGVEFIKPGQEISPEELKLRRKLKLSEYKIKIGSLCASFLEDPENRVH